MTNKAPPPRRARLPALHTGVLQGVVDKLATYPRRLGDLGEDYFFTVMFDESWRTARWHYLPSRG